MVIYVVETLIRLAYVVGIGMIIYSGLKMAWSRGDPGEFGKAKTMLLYVIIGLAIMFGVGLIVDTLAEFGQDPSNIL